MERASPSQAALEEALAELLLTGFMAVQVTGESSSPSLCWTSRDSSMEKTGAPAERVQMYLMVLFPSPALQVKVTLQVLFPAIID